MDGNVLTRYPDQRIINALTNAYIVLILSSRSCRNTNVFNSFDFALQDDQAAIEKAFQFDDEVIVEEFLAGREFSNGAFRHGRDIQVLPITEIRSQNEFFDYQAKYEQQSQEITPADLDDSARKSCQALSRRLYETLNCRGATRFDYILCNDQFYFLEANTIPGMSEQSIFPQQTIAQGWTIGQLLDAVIEEALME